MNHDRNLLFGIVALQMDFIHRDALIQAMHAWVLDKTKPLGRILVEQEQLTPGRRQVLEALVEEHLAAHAQDPKQSLAALAVSASDLHALTHSVADADVRDSLSSVPGSGSTDLETTVDHIPTDSDGGRYRILRPHAKGGLGEVFVALDEELHREVALKAIQEKHAEDAASRSRFVLEAEITGGLEHPGIVPVYGFGHYPDGRPYYAMRFLRGDNLKQAIARFYETDWKARDPGQRMLAFRQLLRRFVDVCNTVAYAHSRGVLHRDVKPGNVMLGSYGETLLVDWGLAKASGPDGEAGKQIIGEATLHPASGSGEAMTQTGQILGTPAYMSPEQAAGAGAQIGPASDIYSLGATLYVLLAGQAPVAKGEMAEVLDKVRRGAIPPPRQVQPDTPPALEAICCKAMALRAQDRYASALDLAADVEHWLGDEAVAAYTELWPARLGRWTRRHRPLVAAAAALLVAAVIGLSAGTILLSRANEQTRKQELDTARQRDLAEENFRQARAAVDEYFTKVSENKLLQSPLPGLQPLRKELLEAALRYYQQFAQQQQGKTELQQELATAYYRAAEINHQVAVDQEAESQVLKAIAILEPMVRQEPANAEAMEVLARSQGLLGQILGRNGHFQDARAAFASSRSFWEDLLRQDSLNVQWQFQLSKLFEEKGVINANANEIETAHQDYDQAIAILRPLVRSHPNNADYASMVALVYRQVGNLSGNYRNQPEKALEYLMQALPIQQRLTHDYPSDLNHQSNLAAIYTTLTEMHSALHHEREAAHYAQQALSLREKLARENPSVAKFQYALVYVYRMVGKIHRLNRRPIEALQFFEKALPLGEKLRADHPTNSEYGQVLGLLYNSIGILHITLGREKEAQSAFERSLTILESLAKKDPTSAGPRVDAAMVQSNLGDSYRRKGELESALQVHRRSHAFFSELAREQPAEETFRSYLAFGSLRLGEVYRALGRSAEAAVHLKQARDLVEKQKNRGNTEYYVLAGLRVQEYLLGTKAEQARRQHELDQAMDDLREALAAGYEADEGLDRDLVLEPLWSRPDFQKLVADMKKGTKEAK
jgi:serine/threonine-protein kinase